MGAVWEPYGILPTYKLPSCKRLYFTSHHENELFVCSTLTPTMIRAVVTWSLKFVVGARPALRLPPLQAGGIGGSWRAARGAGLCMGHSVAGLVEILWLECSATQTSGGSKKYCRAGLEYSYGVD